MSLVRFPVNCCAETDEVVNKYCFVVWVCGARRDTTVFHKAAGELIECRVELRARIIVHSSKMFQFAKPFARSTHRWRSRGSGHVLLRGCHQKL